MAGVDFVILGSNSFSGASFIRTLLDSDFSVVGVSRSAEISLHFRSYHDSSLKSGRFRFFQLDLNKNCEEIISLIDRFRPKYVVNFAAQGMVAESWLNPVHWYQTNLLSQVGFHEQLRLREFIERYVHVTTPEVYGSTRGMVDELHPFNPTTPYAVSRAACDLHLASFYKAYDFPVVFTRSANVYGPCQQLYRIIPRSIIAGRLGIPLRLHGGGVSERCFIHISDAMNATLKIAIGGKSGDTYHISAGEPISISDLVLLTFARLSVDPTGLVLQDGERLGKDQSYLLDSSKLRKELDWSPGIEIEVGIDQTIAWFDANRKTLEQEGYEYVHKI